MLPPGRCSVGIGGLSTGFFYLQLATKILMYPAIKLWPFVGYNQLGYSKPIQNVLPYKLNNLFIFDGCESFGFYPYTEIVGGK